MQTQQENRPGPVLRITVERRDGVWREIDRYRAPEMTIPSSSELPPTPESTRLTGAWVEAVDAKGEVLYRRLLKEPPRGVEIFHEDGSMSRVTADSDEYSMDLLIPDLPEIQAINLFIELDEPPGKEVPRKAEPVAVFPARRDEPPRQSAERS
jgi:hypothetical protein